MKYVTTNLQFPFFYALFFLPKVSFASNTISPTHPIKDGDTLISSPNENFELGFFSPGTTTNRYLGIWYKEVQPQTIVWVANRNNPIPDSSGILQFGTNGNLILLSGSTSMIWSSNVSNVVIPMAQLLDTGNFIILEQGSSVPEWESFDHPTDTLLSGMKLGWNLKIGLERYLTSWKNPNDPSIGDCSFRIDLKGIPQGFLFNKGVPKTRIGSWNGKQFSGVPIVAKSSIFNFTCVINREEIFYSFYLKDELYKSRFVLNNSCVIERFTWVNTTKMWNVFWTAPNDECDPYNVCGAHGVCNQEERSICSCMQGFQQKKTNDRSSGCVLKDKFECGKTDRFLKMEKMKLPDTSRANVVEKLNITECQMECRRNCSCKGFATYNVTDGSGCMIWIDDLKDLRVLMGAGEDLYVRVATPESDSGVPKQTKYNHERKKPKMMIIILTVILGIFLFGFGICLVWRKKVQKMPPEARVYLPGASDCPGEKKDDLQLVLFDMDTIVAATYNFSSGNMLGQGGFGCVYKGTLENGQEIAVKRLSKNSGQGVDEFMNEVMLIARLQHRNLVRLLGSCIEGEEKMLVYEYMENKGLDSILFNRINNFKLDWPTRFNIIMGISRGLLYLHQDSRFRVIHRDLKTSNVLLDREMNPKISDFGLARIFGGDDTEGKTKRVVGTYGYMSPEYAMDGIFSIKSDVFSFGVLVLEIITGKMNKGFFCPDGQPNLLGYAWRLWREGEALKLIDETLEESCRPNEALRCIQVGLLCVQERAENRPTMSSVCMMLSSDATTLPKPRQPGFCFVRSPFEIESTSSKKEASVNHVTVTILEPR